MGVGYIDAASAIFLSSFVLSVVEADARIIIIFVSRLVISGAKHWPLAKKYRLVDEN